MNDTIKEFLVGLGFHIDEAGLKKFVDGITSASLRAAAFGAAVTAAAGFVMKGIDDVAKDGEKLDQLAKKYNTTAEAMDNFGDTAEIVGIGQDKAFESMDALSRVVSEAALGIGRGKIVLEKLGIEAKDSSGHIRAITDVMDDLSKKLSTMDRGQAMNIMDRLGLDPKLLKMFNGSLGDTVAIGNELNTIDESVGFDFDRTIAESKAYVKSHREMMIQVRLLKMWFDKLWERMATDLMPKVRAGMERISKVMETMRMSLQANGKKIIEGLQPFLNLILRLAESFTTFVARVISVGFKLVSSVLGIFSKLNEASNGWIGYLAIALAAWKTFNLGFLATPIGAIAGVAVAILALYDDFMTWKEGGDSLIDWAAWEPGINAALSAIDAFMSAVNSLATAVGYLIDAFVKLFSGDFAGFFDSILEMGGNVIDMFASMFDMVSKVGEFVGGIGSAIGGMFSGSPSAPTPQAQAAIAGNTANVNQATTITVNGSNDPQATAKAVAAQQKDVNASMTRNVKGAAK